MITAPNNTIKCNYVKVRIDTPNENRKSTRCAKDMDPMTK